MVITDKIMQGLACHARSDCSGCPYEDQPECSSQLAADAEKMYKQLERERDAAVSDLEANKRCETCKHYTPGYFCLGCRQGSNWQWRGVEVE